MTTPSPKPCCDKCSGRVEDESGFSSNYGCQNESCPNCHQAKPDTLYVDARTPEERKNDAGIKSVTTTSSPEVSPAKEEKECGCQGYGCVACEPWTKKELTLTEQKAEWEEEFNEKFLPTLKIGDFKGLETMKEIKSFIAAKLAQKEQAVKAEIREMIEKIKSEHRKIMEKDYHNHLWNLRQDGYNQALNDVSSLLSDKVNH